MDEPNHQDHGATGPVGRESASERDHLGGRPPSDDDSSHEGADPAASAGRPADEEGAGRLGAVPRADDTGTDDRAAYSELGAALGQRVYNNFYGRVDAAGSAFGFGSAAAPGHAPGFVEPDEIDRVLRHYLYTDEYDEAAGKLRSERILVLAGEDGSGRRAGAFALLRDMLGEGAGIRSLSPANSLARLASPDVLKSDSGYVILDYVGEIHADPVQDHQLRLLSGALRKKQSFLVITASAATLRRLALKEFCVSWRAPEPLTLFDHCTDRAPQRDTDGVLAAELRERVSELRRPDDVVKVAARLVDHSVDAALTTLRDSAKATVQKWFQEKPAADDLLPVAALAFLNGVPERKFEELVVSLTLLARNWEKTPEEPLPSEEPPPQQTLNIEQSRARWQNRAVNIAESVRPDGQAEGSRGERRITFTSHRVRELVIGELHDLYGYELWYPLRQWLEQLSKDPDIEVRTEVARGVALLARHTLAEVDERMLRVWADGLSAQRVTAAFVLQFMCDDERLAPQALSIALGWTANAGQERAITATMAFAGELGSLYCFDTLTQLWLLTLRAERIAVAARNSLMLLLGTSAHDPARSVLVLRYLRTKAVRASRPEARANTLELIVQVLRASALDGSGKPLVSLLLRTNQDAITHFGSLWTTVLLSGRRAEAVTALCRTLEALHDVPAAAGTARALGEAMRRSMNPGQWAALRNDLSIALNHPQYALPGARHLAQILLGVVRSRTTTEGTAQGRTAHDGPRLIGTGYDGLARDKSA